MLIDLRLAQAFVAVADAGSFVNAADRLHIGQSGLSQQIKRLEQTLGESLFERTSRSVEITELGRRLYPVAQELLAAAERFADAARADTHQSVLRVAVAENGVNPIAVALLTAVRADIDEVDLEIIRVGLDTQHTALEPDVDVVIGRPPYGGELPLGVRRTTVGSDPVVVVARAGDALLDAEAVGSAEIAARTCLVNESVPDAWRTVSSLFVARSVGAANVEVDSFRTACARAAVSSSVAVMPESFAMSYRVDGLAWRPIDDVAPMNVELLTRSGSAEAIVERLIHHAAQFVDGFDVAGDRSA